MAVDCIISKPENRETFADLAALYVAARDAARAADKRDAARESAMRRRAGTFVFDGEEIHSLAQLENLRPCEPMDDAALAETIEKIRAGNETARAEYPEKIAAFERALAKARAHFETSDAERANAGLNDDPDGDDRWSGVEVMEIRAYEAPVKSISDAAAFLRLLQDFFQETGVNDTRLDDAIPARIFEAIAVLEAQK